MLHLKSSSYLWQDFSFNCISPDFHRYFFRNFFQISTWTNFGAERRIWWRKKWHRHSDGEKIDIDQEKISVLQKLTHIVITPRNCNFFYYFHSQVQNFCDAWSGAYSGSRMRIYIPKYCLFLLHTFCSNINFTSKALSSKWWAMNDWYQRVQYHFDARDIHYYTYKMQFGHKIDVYMHTK